MCLLEGSQHTRTNKFRLASCDSAVFVWQNCKGRETWPAPRKVIFLEVPSDTLAHQLMTQLQSDVTTAFAELLPSTTRNLNNGTAHLVPWCNSHYVHEDHSRRKCRTKRTTVAVGASSNWEKMKKKRKISGSSDHHRQRVRKKQKKG